MWITASRRRFVAREGAFELVGHRRWLGSWSVSASSLWPGERMTLYITAGTVRYGYWRDLLVGDAAFDRRHFVYSDNPALLPVIVGPETRRAITAAGPRFALHVHRSQIVSEEQTDVVDEALAERHHAVHAALAADHARAIERWRGFAELFDGRVLAKWPPVLALYRPIGTIVMSLTWQLPQSTDLADWASCGESLASELVAERGAAGSPWRLDPGLATIGAHRRIGDRHFEVTGEPALSRAELDDAVTRAGIRALRVDRLVTVELAGMVGDRARLEAAIRLMTRIVAPSAPDSPYR